MRNIVSIAMIHLRAKADEITLALLRRIILRRSRAVDTPVNVTRIVEIMDAYDQAAYQAHLARLDHRMVDFIANRLRGTMK